MIYIYGNGRQKELYFLNFIWQLIYKFSQNVEKNKHFFGYRRVPTLSKCSLEVGSRHGLNLTVQWQQYGFPPNYWASRNSFVKSLLCAAKHKRILIRWGPFPLWNYLFLYAWLYPIENYKKYIYFTINYSM